MAFRNIIIENPARISVRQEQLLIKTDTEHSVAIEDISALLLESQQSTVTTAALSRLGQCGCAVFVCDEKHMPCAVLEPFGQNSRGYGMLKLQLGLGAVLKKQLWQQIVSAKISNQAKCLELCGKVAAAQGLASMAVRVSSGDSGNMEAAAAQRYFPALFGDGFTREEDCGINAALNYGYAILRGTIARNLSVYGFLPALGLHHRSELNNFNLADDLMEPFRPLVDLLVATLPDWDKGLTPGKKRLIFNCLNLDMSVSGKAYTAAYGSELLVQSLAKSLKQDMPALNLPVLLPLNQHRYE